MEIQSKHMHAKISPQKARLIAPLIKGKPISEALYQLTYLNKKASVLFKKVLDSAIANAEFNFGYDIDSLYVSNVIVEQGRTLKRFHARARGRGNRITKRTSHIIIKLKA